MSAFSSCLPCTPQTMQWSVPAAQNTHRVIWESRGQNDSSFLSGNLEKMVKIQMNRGWSYIEIKFTCSHRREKVNWRYQVFLSVSVHTWPRPESNSSSMYGSPLVPSLPITVSSPTCRNKLLVHPYHRCPREPFHLETILSKTNLFFFSLNPDYFYVRSLGHKEGNSSAAQGKKETKT